MRLSPSLDQRQSGVLLHITSLPGPFKQGVLGQEALQFMDRLKDSGYRVWQFLPLGPTHGHGSPYESLSSSAGNPELIDLRYCHEQGWLSHDDLTAVMAAEMQARTARAKSSLKFWKDLKNQTELAQKLQAFEDENSTWLNDYALFSSLKTVHEGMAWWDWPQALRDRNTNALDSARDTLASHIQQVVFEQFLFTEQWATIKAQAENRGIQLFGDLPIYVAHDSSDVWANRDFFTVNDIGLCEEVAGVPPDYFSETGQRWGNPLYVWDQLKNDNFQWWIDRVAVQVKRMHMLRIDHFRGLEAYWAIPGHRDDGIEGEWRKAPGEDLLQALQDHFGDLPLIAEDLGLITPEVHALREKFALPGMKILQFAFGGSADNTYLPHHHSVDMVTYTGTHDNNTSLGWWQQACDAERHHVCEYYATDGSDMPWPFIRSALASVATLSIIPMQDLLALDATARFNIPGTIEHNWCWRMQSIPDASEKCWQQSKQLNHLYHRI